MAVLWLLPGPGPAAARAGEALPAEADQALAAMDFPRLKEILHKEGRSREWLDACDAMEAAFQAACRRVNEGSWKPDASELLGMRGKVLGASRSGIELRGRGMSLRLPWKSLTPARRGRFLAGAAEKPDASLWTARVAYAVLSRLGEVAASEASAARNVGAAPPEWLSRAVEELAGAAAAGRTAMGGPKEKTEPRAARATTDWPSWRGPNRNGVVNEDSGWASGGWPPGEAVWSKNVGLGGTSPVVVGGRLYAMGWEGGTERVYCLDAATGREIWKRSYRCPKHGRYAAGDRGSYSGPSSTPEYDLETGRLYTLSLDGDLNCWDAAGGGRRVWGMNLYERYGVKRRPDVGKGVRDYGYTTSPLVHGDRVIVEVGSDEGNLMAFDKRTGTRKWTSRCRDPAGHTGGPVPITVQGVPCVAVLTVRNLLVVRLDGGNEGKTAAKYGWVTDYANSIATPAVYRNYVLITSGYNHRKICNVKITLRGAVKVWERPHLSKVCSPVIHNGRIYWAWTKLRCLDFATGRQLWEGGDFGNPGSCIVTGDGRLIAWGRRGRLVLAETADRSPGRYTELARKDDVFSAYVWPHVVLSAGRLYCKDCRGNIKCFEVRASAPGADP